MQETLRPFLQRLSTCMERTHSGEWRFHAAGLWRTGSRYDLERWVTDWLYVHYYRALAKVLPSGAKNLRPFVQTLRRAAEGFFYWEPGWQLVSSSSEWLYVTNGSLALLVEDAEAETRGTRDDLRIKIPCARPNLLPGFFYFIGPAGLVDLARPTVRIYLNLAPETAPIALRSLLSGLASEDLRLEGKLVDDPRGYDRCDSMVLYVNEEDYVPAVRYVTEWVHARDIALRAGTPALTKPLGHGMAAAQTPLAEPGRAAESFGRHRCRLIAQGLVEGLSRDEADPDAWIRRVAVSFEAAGTSLMRPYAQTIPECVL